MSESNGVIFWRGLEIKRTINDEYGEKWELDSDLNIWIVINKDMRSKHCTAKFESEDFGNFIIYSDSVYECLGKIGSRIDDKISTFIWAFNWCDDARKEV